MAGCKQGKLPRLFHPVNKTLRTLLWLCLTLSFIATFICRFDMMERDNIEGIVLGHVLVKSLEGRCPFAHVIHEPLLNTSPRVEMLTLDSYIVIHFTIFVDHLHLD
jgi:hypothetical protein